MSLPTPSETVEKLQNSLQTKAKAEPAFRLYALWDKVFREDILLEPYRRCRANAGAAGVDGETFERIENIGVERWLGMLRERLKSGNYEPSPSCECRYQRAMEASGLSASRPSATLWRRWRVC
jgi:RNA-directed DNA polymerase